MTRSNGSRRKVVRSIMRKELVGASTMMLVLGTVARESSWGYEIVRKLNASADGLFEWSEGTIYPLLHKLEKQQLVRSRWQESESGRLRKYYSITAKGRAKLSAEAEGWSMFHRLIAQVLEASNG
jgi:PadR family transcriptional regulator PadR